MQEPSRNWGFIAAIVCCLIFWLLVIWLGAKAWNRWAADESRSEPKLLCISTIGPVDQNGRGNVVAQVSGPECP